VFVDLEATEVLVKGVPKGFAALRGATAVDHDHDEAELGQSLRLVGVVGAPIPRGCEATQDVASLRALIDRLHHRVPLCRIEIPRFEEHPLEGSTL
jgi:hypothetical protein